MFIFNYLASLLSYQSNNHVKKEEGESVVPGSFRGLPDDVISGIFSYLNPRELTKFSRVSKEWKKLTSQNFLWNAFDHKKLFPGSQILDEKVWQKHCDLQELEISLDDAPLCDTRTKIIKLARIYSSIQGKIEGDAGVTLLMMPKGLTFNKLVQFASSPKTGNKIGFKGILDGFSQKHGDKSISKTHYVVISNAPLAGSRSLSITQHQELVGTIGCTIPKVLEVATLALLTYVSSPSQSPVRLFDNDKSVTFVRSLEKVDDFHVEFGGFAPDGPYVESDYDDYLNDFKGVAGQWTF